MSEQKRNILQRINAVRKAIGYVQKDKSVSTGGGSYKAVTHDVVTALVRGPMIDAGIICIPNLITSCAHQKEEGAKQFRYDATYEFVFASEDDPKDNVVIKIEAHAMDNADKAPGKALSYAKKYALLKLFEIETGEDEESRYQPSDFDVAPHIEAIMSSKDMKDLKTTFQAAYKEATASGDKDAMKELMSAKDTKKKSLEIEIAGQA